MTDLTRDVQALFSRSERIRRKPKELSPSVIRHDRLDEGTLDDLRKDARNFDPTFNTPTVDTPDLTADVPEGTDPPVEEKPYEPWEDLVSDVFYGYHTYDHPQIEAGENVKASRQLHRRILEQIVHADGFGEARKDTRHDPTSSALATMRVTDTLRELLQDELLEAAERAQEMAQHEKRMEEALANQQGLREQLAQQDGGLTPEQRQEARQNAQQRSQAKKAIEDLAAQQAQTPIGLDAAQAIEEATSEAQEQAEASASLPGNKAGEMQKLPPDQALALAKKINANPNVQEVLKRFGRIERDMRYRRTNRVVGGREEIVDVELGNDLTRLLPSEMLKLQHPLLELDFMRRFHERGLLQYEMIGEAEAGNGPIVLTLDVSGSMHGEKDWWARGCALGLLSIAHREKRDFAVVEFDTEAKPVLFFPGRQPIDPEKVIEFAGRGAHGGGTDITSGLARASGIISSVSEFNKADIVIATDGQDHLDQTDYDLRNDLRNRGVRIHGVAVGMSSNAWLEEVCDDQVSVFDLSAPSEATTHLAEHIT